MFTDKLGSGTYATVYKAYRTTGPRTVVAVKCVLKSSLTKTSTENLLTEIELLKVLKHDHIVELKDFQWDDSYIYLIMEYCSGGDLSHFIRSKRKLPVHIVRRFLRQIVRALAFLREHNVAHMDLKPQNLLLTSKHNPSVKIADFGFAKHILDGMELIMLRGSPLYMAPEIVCKGAYDARVDLWSIGVILYECLFGQAPFASQTYKELGEKIWDTKPVELPYGVDIPDSCRHLLLGLLQRDPEKRMSFEEFFNHPFLDLEHMPAKDSLDKATSIVTKAVRRDTEGDYKTAVKLYCEALEYFVPAISFEKDRKKKEILRARVKDYMDRAEVLKEQLKPGSNNASGPEGTLQRSNSTLVTGDKLWELGGDNQEVAAALKLIKAAELEEEADEFQKALDHYEIALGALIKILQSEPRQQVKELLRRRIDKSMSKAEQIKTYLSVKQLNTVDTSQKEEEVSNSYSDQCMIQ